MQRKLSPPPKAQPKKKSATTAWIILGSILAVLIGLGFLAVHLFIHMLSNSTERAEIYLRDLASNEEKRLTHDGRNLNPKISPDGKYLVYTHTSSFGSKEPSVMKVLDIAGGNARDLGSDKTYKRDFSWTANGQELCYQVMDGSANDFWLLNLDTGAQNQLTRDQARKSHGQISPDGKWLAYTQKGDKEREEVFVLNISEGQEKQLTHTQNFMNLPEGLAWTADNKHLAYLTPLHIYLLNLDGEVQKTADILPLQNATNLFAHRCNQDKLFFKARLNPNTLGWKLFAYDWSDNTFTPLLDAQIISNFDLSWDGNSLVFEKTAPPGP